MGAVLEYAQRVQVLARRDVAQREGLAHHRAAGRVQRVHVLDELVAQPALEERRAQRRRADGLEHVAGFGLQRHGGSSWRIRAAGRSAAGLSGWAAGRPRLRTRFSPAGAAMHVPRTVGGVPPA